MPQPSNALDRETSPYLLQHKDNPVHWRPWGSDAFALAQAENKPILLSVGYAACHWCHVMAHESFEDPAIAALMNELFVNIKVDREERPDVDAIYQAALALTGQHGGWPLTMFLTPEGEPFWGGTYFPSEAKYGRPGFPDILRRVADVYRDDPDAIAKNRSALLEGLAKLAEPAPDSQAIPLSPGILDQAAEHMAKEVDQFRGGIGPAPKFPQTYLFETLWRAWLRTGAQPFFRAVEITLQHMCQGGIYDHLGGGFARYSTDDRWLAPHFEKMLYDNAQLLELLTLAWQGTKAELYAARIRETVDWTLREMIADGGGFAATLDADSEGVEGKFYVWSEAEIDAVLDADATVFKAAYDVSAAGNWEGHNILNRSASVGQPADGGNEALLASCRARLMAVRDERIRPGWDDKVLADWNGLMIAAMANAGAAFAEPDWLAAAERAFAFVVAELADGDRLLHAHRQGRSQHAGMLDDYAQMARAALVLYELTGTDDYLAWARRWAATVQAQFLDARHGGYFQTAADSDHLVTRMRSCTDNAVPSGNGTMAGVFTRLWLLTGEDVYRDQAEGIFAAFSPELTRNLFPLTSFLNAVDLFLQPLQIVIIGGRDDPEVQALLRALHDSSQPNRVLQVLAPGASLPESHPARGKAQADGGATAYVCIGTTCSLPLTDPAALSEALPRPPGT